MNKNSIKRVLSIVLVLLVSISMFSTALAASKSYKGISRKSYTITTGKKSATLSVSQSAGKVSATTWKNLIKKTTKTVTKSMRGEFDICVSGGGSKTTKTINYPFNSKASFSLKPNTTYTVNVIYKDFSDELNGAWNPKWKTNPTVKLTTNNSAKIK